MCVCVCVRENSDSDSDVGIERFSNIDNSISLFFLSGWIATILMNVTQLPEGRKILLDEEKNMLKDLLKDITHRNVIRKRGVIGSIK